ncbi:MAG TPA: SDR family oxidoreductase [Deltaproteobacteria bacterium]|nr:SDR family oxidoreductase [Deltaproteobacteria bacterium]HPR54014.1 SDR family oxidoreductase [Deltaproteobacteria bacterium]HXK46363.1 SDR family oxidoreductase [Deltaproteobacteria bacterium]
MKHILITGVSGYFGQKLVGHFKDKPDVERITGIDIRPPASGDGKLEFIRCDVRDDLEKVFTGRSIDCVIHTAYILPPIHDTALMEDININGTKNVLSAAAASGVRWIMDCSSTTAYGFHPDNPAVLTEESELRGNEDFTYAKNKREIEGWMGGFEKDHPEIGLTVIRPCFVVGPGFTNPLARHLCKKLCILPLTTADFQYIHEDDLVEIMYLLLMREKAGVYNLAADGTMTFGEMLSILGNLPLRVPAWLLWPLNDLAWKLRLSFITEFPSPSLNLTRYPWIASNEKVKRELGYRFRYTTKTAFESFAAYVKGRG